MQQTTKLTSQHLVIEIGVELLRSETLTLKPYKRTKTLGSKALITW